MKTTRTIPPIEDRLKARLVRTPSECLEWTGGKVPGGYGAIYRPINKQVLTHRLAWELANDRAVPDGMCVCHTCDNPPCCNPEHLFLGTHRDNMRDKSDKGRADHVGPPYKTHCLRGHQFTMENTTIDANGNRVCIECSRIRNRRRAQRARDRRVQD